MRRRVVALCGAMLIAVSAPMGGETSFLGVSAVVVANCRVVATNLQFGEYDPIATHAASPLDASGQVVIQCTRGTSTNVFLSAGGTGPERVMASTTDELSYGIYRDSSRSIVWGLPPDAGRTDGLTRESTITLYGRIFAGQDVLAGSYGGTLTAEVEF